MYGAHFYSEGAQQNWKTMEPLYNQTIRKITGSLLISPVSSIVAETEALPLELHIKLKTMTKAIKWLLLHDENGEVGMSFIERAQWK